MDNFGNSDEQEVIFEKKNEHDEEKIVFFGRKLKLWRQICIVMQNL